ncbi:MAG TPA: flagellar FlbD family protein [Oscillatoriaceae cyanobacterium]
MTRLNGSEFTLNAELIETVEATPDTVITLNNEHRWVVREGVHEVIERVVAYKRRIHAGPLGL